MNKKNWLYVATAFVMILVLAVYLFNLNEKQASQEAVSNIKQLVHEYSIGTLTNESASITSNELIVTDSRGMKRTYDLPADEFFVSIAPYLNETHPCAIHSLTGCQGELANQEFDVVIQDLEGNEVLNQTLKTLDNGFIDLWLPREQTFHITISSDGKTAESQISTYKGDNTCITTMQLS